MGNSGSTTTPAADTFNKQTARIAEHARVKHLRDLVNALDLKRVTPTEAEDRDVWPTQYSPSLPGYVNKEGMGSCLLVASRQIIRPRIDVPNMHYLVMLVRPFGDTAESGVIATDDAPYFEVPSTITVNGIPVSLVLHLRHLITRFDMHRADPAQSSVYIASLDDDKHNSEALVMTFQEFVHLADSDKSGSTGYAYAWAAFRHDNPQTIIRYGLDRLYTRGIHSASIVGSSRTPHSRQISSYTAHRSAADRYGNMHGSSRTGTRTYPDNELDEDEPEFFGSRFSTGLEEDTERMKTQDGEELIGEDLEELLSRDRTYSLAPAWYKPPPAGDVLSFYDKSSSIQELNADVLGGSTNTQRRASVQHLREEHLLQSMGIASRIPAHATVMVADRSLLSHGK